MATGLWNTEWYLAQELWSPAAFTLPKRLTSLGRNTFIVNKTTARHLKELGTGANLQDVIIIHLTTNNVL